METERKTIGLTTSRSMALPARMSPDNPGLCGEKGAARGAAQGIRATCAS